MNAQTAPKIRIGDDIAYERGWPTHRFVVSINDVWLKRKDGGLRKFKTKQAARAAALKAQPVIDDIEEANPSVEGY